MRYLVQYTTVASLRPVLDSGLHLRTQKKTDQKTDSTAPPARSTNSLIGKRATRKKACRRDGLGERIASHRYTAHLTFRMAHPSVRPTEGKIRGMDRVGIIQFLYFCNCWEAQTKVHWHDLVRRLTLCVDRYGHGSTILVVATSRLL